MDAFPKQTHFLVLRVYSYRRFNRTYLSEEEIFVNNLIFLTLCNFNLICDLAV